MPPVYGVLVWALLLAFASNAASRVARFGLRSSDAKSLAQRAAQRAAAPAPVAPSTLKLLRPTHSGYLPVDITTGRDIFHVFFEAEDPITPLETTPIILWLQGGPGCSSLFGMLYINGPYFVQPDFSLKKNPGAWTHRFGMMFVDQPVGTGYSHTGNAGIPDNELDVAVDMYKALQSFYKAHPLYQKRPLIVLGESYAGKYVPSIAHFILQADLVHQNRSNSLHHGRAIPPDTEPPVFALGAVGIGNGFTDARLQLSLQAQVAWSMGLIDSVQKEAAESLQAITLDLMLQGQWRKARQMSDLVMGFITNVSATQALEDIRRNEAYDAADLTGQYLNFPEVKADIHADPSIVYSSCSPAVDDVMGPDVMRSTHHLVADLVHFTPLLLYQGQFDAECGYAANEAWINRMAWKGHAGFRGAVRQLWYNGSSPEVMGYVKRYNHLTHVMIRNAGHMVPHDRPEVAQQMLESWLLGALHVRHPNEWNLTDYSIDTAALPPNIWGPNVFTAGAEQEGERQDDAGGEERGKAVFSSASALPKQTWL